MAVWFVINNMAGMDNPETQQLDLYSCCCLLGYSMLPIVLYAAVALLIPRYVIVDIQGWCLRDSVLLL